MKTNEDELLKSLFNKIQMDKAPDDLTFRVMEQIMVNPEIETARKFYHDWWWSGIGLLSLLSMYFTGVFSFLDKVFTSQFIAIYSMLAGYVGGLAEFLPANVIIFPSSNLLPLILPGIMFVLLMDAVFGQRLRRVAY